jgi:hypothetical protein
VTRNNRNPLEGLVLCKKAFYSEWSYVKYLNCNHKGLLNGKQGTWIQDKVKTGIDKEYTNPFELKEHEFGLEVENYNFGTTCNIIIMMFGLSFTNKCYSI